MAMSAFAFAPQWRRMTIKDELRAIGLETDFEHTVRVSLALGYRSLQRSNVDMSWVGLGMGLAGSCKGSRRGSVRISVFKTGLKFTQMAERIDPHRG